MKWQNKSLSYWLRVLHRDLGYLMVGACLIYAVSGILLNHMNGKDPAFRTTEAAVQLEKGMQAEELLAAWNRQEDLPPVKRVLSIDESHHRLMLEGGVGVYDAASGCVDYEVHEKRPVVYWFNRLHYNRIQGWISWATFRHFAGILCRIRIVHGQGKKWTGRTRKVVTFSGYSDSAGIHLAGCLNIKIYMIKVACLIGKEAGDFYVFAMQTVRFLRRNIRFTQGKHTFLHRET